MITQAAPVANLGFELGDFTGFQHSGFRWNEGGPSFGGPTYQTFLTASDSGTATADSNGVLHSQRTAFDGHGNASAALAPANGNFVAFVSNQTSEGNASLTGSSISTKIVVPAGGGTLSLDLRLLNNDARSGFAASDDFGGVALTIGGSTISEYDIDLDPNSPANAHVSGGLGAGGFLNSTDWLHPTFNLANFGGKTLTLTAYSLNYGGNNNKESRLLVDNIHVNPAFSAIPEPTTWLAGAALLGVCAIARPRPARCLVRA